MKKQLLYALSSALCVALFVVACQKENKSATPPSSIPLDKSVKPDKTWTSGEINTFIVKSIIENNSVFDWATASDDMLFSALQNTDNMLAVGFKKPNTTDEDAVQFNAAKDADWKAAKETLVKLIVASEQKANPLSRLHEIRNGH